MLNLPFIQHFIAVSVSESLSEKLGTEVTIGRIDLGLFNRVIIDDVLMNDRTKHEMFKATRFCAKFEIIPFLKRKIYINSIQLFGFNIRLNKENPKAKPNYQFLIDVLSSKKNSKSSSLDLHINSIIMRRGRFSYDIFSKNQTPGRFNPAHIRLHNISATLALKVLRKDSINAGIKRLDFDGESGFSINKLSFKLTANKHDMLIRNFVFGLENSFINIPDIRLQYESFQAFKHFPDQVRFSFRTKPSYVTLRDISMFVPALKNFKDRMNLSLDLRGSLNKLVLRRFMLSAGKKLQLQMNGSVQNITDWHNTFLHATISNLSINNEGVAFILRNFTKSSGKLPAILANLGDIAFKGKVSGYSSQLSMAGLFHSAAGTLKTDLKLGHKSKGEFTYVGGIAGTNFDLGKLLDNDKLGLSTFDLHVDALHRSSSRYPSIVLKGLISSINYSGYQYKNISIDGQYKNGGFNGKTGIDDPNGSIHLNGSFNLAGKTPEFHFLADIKKIRPNDLNLTDKYKDSEFSAKLKADFTGGSLDRMIGNLEIDSLSFKSPTQNYFMQNMRITSSYKDKQKLLTLKSEMADAEIAGNFSYRTLPASIKNILNHYLPSLVAPVRQVESKNNFKFNATIYNTEILPAMFDIPLHIGSFSRITGYVDDRTHRMHIEGFIPQMRYGNHELQSGYVLCENPLNKIHASIRFNELHKAGAISISINSLAENDTLNTSLNWGNNSKQTYSGQLQTVMHFLKSETKAHIKALMDIKPTDVIVNDTTWQIHPSQVTIDKGYVNINNFLFSSHDRFIHIDGRASSLPSDTLKVDLKDINLSYLFAILNFNDLDFKGEVSGTAYVCELMKKPRLNADLLVRNLTLNDGPLGDGNIVARWDNEKEGINLDAHLHESNLSNTHVTGYIYPLKPKNGLDLEIAADRTNIKFVQHFTLAIFNELNGRATGKAHLYGKFKELNLDADLLANANVKVGILNTNFAIKDSLHITPTGIRFKNTKVSDLEGHTGTADGYITFKNFKNFDYRLQFNFNDVLVMNTHETEGLPFYGKIYATGNTILQGGTRKGLDITAAVKTDKNTTFVYINRNTASAINNQFITFFDRTPRRAVDSVEVINPLEDVLKDVSGDVHLNLLVDATPDATLKIIMDPIAGDYITAKGSGNIRGDFYNKGDFKMFGTYRINQGSYKFSLQEVIRKDFTIKDGSTITFNGAPIDANLNLQAVYTVNSASLTDLIPKVSTIVKQTTVKVNCLMYLTGLLPHPTITFGLELPNEQDEIQTLVRNYISTDEQMNTQILYLLSIGKFYTQDNTNTTQSSNMMSSVLSSTISGQLNNILSQVIDNNNWNFGTNLSTGQNGWTDMEVEGVLSGRLLNNRLLVNGNFGYRDNALSNTNFIGDFEADLLLTRSGDIRLKAYNETNDRYYTKTNLTTQGIGIIFQKDFDKWTQLFFWNKWKLKTTIPGKKKKSTEKSASQPIK